MLLIAYEKHRMWEPERHEFIFSANYESFGTEGVTSWHHFRLQTPFKENLEKTLDIKRKFVPDGVLDSNF
jgi:hypothetical protein